MASEHAPSQHPAEPVVVTRAAGRTLAFRVSDAIETLRPLPVEPPPKPAPALVGMTIVRGSPIPVVDVRHLLGEQAPPPAERWLVVRTGARQVALALDQVEGILQEPTRFESAPLLEGLDTPPVAWIAKRDRELLMVLDAARLLEAPGIGTP